MEGIVNIFAFCVYFGVMILCAVLVIYSVLRWIGHPETRDTRLYILSRIAFVILLFMFSGYYIKHLEEPYGDENRNEIVETEQLSGYQDDSGTFGFSRLTNGCLTIIKTVIGSLLFVVVFASAVTLLFIVILCIYNGLRTIIQWILGTQKPKSDQFQNVLKQSTVKLVVTFGILSFFFILPMLVGEQGGGDLMETWTDGIIKIDSFFDFSIAGAEENGASRTEESKEDKESEESDGTDTTDQSDNDLVAYILVYIIVMGVGFSVGRLLYAVIEQVLLKGENVDLIDKYSSPIALLSVGVAFLLALQGGKISADNGFETIGELTKSFLTVVFIIAIVILTLEVVRLLMDIRQKLIRQEAKYLFISLVGQSALLVLRVLNFIYRGLCGIIGVAESPDLENVEVKLERRIVEKMEQQIDCVNDDDHDENYRSDFSGFDEKVTKK